MLLFIVISFLLQLFANCSVSWICKISWWHLCRWVRPLTNKSCFGCGWQLIMLEDEILVTVQSVTRLPKWSCDLPHSTSALTGLHKQSERSDPIHQLVILSHNTDMILPSLFFKLLMWQTSTKLVLSRLISCINIRYMYNSIVWGKNPSQTVYSFYLIWYSHMLY